LHHANPNDHNKDPDHVISTSGALWWLPLRIFYHDYFFFSRGLYKQKNNLQIYFIDRIIQIGLVTIFWVNGKLDIWIYYWLPSILIIGFGYGLFQFYFPHYTTQKVDTWRNSDQKNILQKVCLFAVDFSKYYHYKHHQKISSNLAYFPFWSYLQDRFLAQKKLSEMMNEIKY
jgi:beta-carotene hydroxylase